MNGPSGITATIADETAAHIRSIERPHRSLWTYYKVSALVGGPLYPLFLFLGWIRYSTLQYTFTDEGISMRWGRLFRREILLNYARIQDIHLRSNVVERWLGLSRILIQTASGSSGAEMTIEGLKEYEAIRDFLYARMRGVQDDHEGTKPAQAENQSASTNEIVAVLREVAHELRATRQAIEHSAERKETDEAPL